MSDTEQQLLIAGIIVYIGLGVLAGMITAWWANRSAVKELERWESNLVDRELANQGERIEAQRLRLDAHLVHQSAQWMVQDAHLLREGARWMVQDVRRRLYGVAAEAADVDRDMADTVMIPAICTDDTVMR